MRKVRRVFNLLLMELGYQYLRMNATMWRDQSPEHPSLYRKKVEKMIKQAEASGRRWVCTDSAVNEVKLSLRERWQAWSEDGATLTTPYDELTNRTAQRLNELWERLQDDGPSDDLTSEN